MACTRTSPKMGYTANEIRERRTERAQDHFNGQAIVPCVLACESQLRYSSARIRDQEPVRELREERGLQVAQRQFPDTPGLDLFTSRGGDIRRRPRGCDVAIHKLQNA